MSLDITDTLDVLRGHLTDSALLNAIAKDLLKVEREVKASKPPAAKTKTRFALLLRADSLDTPIGLACKAGAFVLAVPDGDDDPTTKTYYGQGLVQRIATAARTHNEAPRKRRAKSAGTIKTFTDAMRTLRPKAIKASGSQFSIRAKGEPAELVVVTREELP